MLGHTLDERRHDPSVDGEQVVTGHACEPTAAVSVPLSRGLQMGTTARAIILNGRLKLFVHEPTGRGALLTGLARHTRGDDHEVAAGERRLQLVVTRVPLHLRAAAAL